MSNFNYSRFILIFCASVFWFNTHAQAVISEFSGLTYSQSHDWQGHKEEMGLSQDEGLKLVDDYYSQSENWTHYRYKQIIDGYEVFGQSLSLHTKDERLESATGYLVDPPSLNRVDLLDTEKIESAARFYTNSLLPAPASQNMTDHMIIETELGIADASFPKLSGNSRWVYRCELSTPDMSWKYELWLDGMSGSVVFEMPLIHTETIAAQGYSLYYGLVDFLCDSVDQQFILRDLTRGSGIYTNRGSGETFTTNSLPWELNATEEASAIDLHWCSSKFYDMMADRFDWKGIDNKDGALIAHVQGYYVNASWNGEYANFGRGDCNHGPLTTLEVVAHEYMHGVTDYTSDLIYSGESGAINESMSDVFGKALEYYVTPQDFDWSIGKSFKINDYSRFFRSMTDPNEKGHPKYYDGLYWNDNNGVHTNSSIGNHFFYLLVEGGQGQNEVGMQYNFDGIGMDKALQIIFLTQRAYLYPSATYDDYYRFSLMAAEELYGSGSDEQQAVQTAWSIVGLPSNRPPIQHDLAVSLQLSTSEACLDDEALPFSYTITNNGSQDFIPTEPVRLRIESYNLPPFTQRLNVGESITITDDENLVINFFDWDWIWLTMDMGDNLDENSRNNRSYVFLTNGNPAGEDVTLSVSQSLEDGCWSDMVTFNCTVSNLACIKSPEDRPAQLEITNSKGDVKTFDYALPLIEFGEPYRFTVTLERSFVEAGLNTWELIAENDPLVINNSVDVSLISLNSKDQTFIDVFTSFDDPDYRSIGWNNTHGIVRYDNDQVLAWSARNEPTVQPCEMVEDLFDFQNRGGFSFCADLAGSWDPKLEFDLNLFRSDEEFAAPELQGQTAGVMVLWKDANESRREIFIDQEEGVWKSHSVDLPRNFQGEITLLFFAHAGYYNLELDSLLKYDLVLLDNLRFNAPVSNTDVFEFNSLTVHPNPVQDVVTATLQHGDIQQVRVIDMNGKVVFSDYLKEKLNTVEVPMAPLPRGVYQLEVVDQYGHIHFKKIIRT